jgi:branched-chain amino acid transport system substrate-binding protein
VAPSPVDGGISVGGATKEGFLMRRMTWLVVLVMLTVAAGWLAAPALSQSKVVKIGDLGSKVGVFEGYGKYQTMGMQLAVEELNAKGGVLGHKVEIVSEDDETKPAPAVRKAEKLILQDEVKLLVGAVSSGATMAVMDVTKKHKTIHWNSVSCAEFMRTTKFHKWYFSNQPDSRMQANGLAKYILDKMGKKVYIFYTDYAMGQSDGRQFKTAFEKLGGEVVGVAGAPLDTKDFSPWFGAINGAAADVLFLAFAGTDSLRLMTQLHSFGMTKKYKLAGIDCFLLQQDLPAIAEPMEGFVQLNHFSAFNPDPNMQAFNTKFKKKFGIDANIAAGAYDAVLFWAAAVEKAKTFDSDKVAEAHEGMCLDNTHIGKQCIRKEDHQVVMDMHLYRVEKGKNIPIARIAGSDTIGAPMVGKDPVEGFTWEIKKKN